MRLKRTKASGGIRRGVYLLPSLFTFGNILLGFYAVICALRGDFQIAAILICAAGFLDALDGRIARATHTESDFGREFDSLADVLTFGAAPAYLSYIWGLQGFGRIGWLIPLFYLLCVSTRLARFNVQAKVVDSRFFVGLPAPAAAGCLMSLLYFSTSDRNTLWPDALMMLGLILTGALMVSTFRYHSLKRLDQTRRQSYRTAIVMAVILLLFAYDPPVVFFSAAVFYVASGPFSWVLGRYWRTATEPDNQAELQDETRP